MKKLIVTALTSLLCVSVWANVPRQMPTGVYSGFSLSLGSRGSTPADEIFSDALFVPRVYAGYRFLPNFSVQAGFADLDDEHGTDYSGNTPYPYKIDIMGPDLSLVANKLVANHFNFYAIAGAAVLKTKLYNKHFSGRVTDIDQTNVVARLGAGAQYVFDNKLALGLDAVYYTKHRFTPETQAYGLSLSYTF